jgi:uncharacterized membrane protein YfhO
MSIRKALRISPAAAEGAVNEPRAEAGLRTYLVIALAIESLFAFYYLVSRKAFSFIDIGSDTFFCFYPLQVAVGRQLHALHELTWSFDLGMGAYLGTLFDPLWFITAWFPDSWQLALRLPLFMTKVVLAGAFFCGYLRVIGFRAIYAAMGALAFAFSSYGTIDAQWDVIIGVGYVQFAAYLFLFETYLRHTKPWAAVCAGIVLGLGYPMQLYSMALFTIVYALARLAIVEKGGIGACVATLARFLAWFGVGLFVTAPILLPAVYYFFESPRVAGDYSLLHTLLGKAFSINDVWTLGSEAGGLLGKDLLGTGSSYRGWGNYFEGPGFYVGILMLVCILQLLGPHATRRERWFCVGGIVAVGAYFLFPVLRFAVYGFGHGGFRFSTLWVSTLLLIMGLTGLRRAQETAPWPTGFILGFAGIVGLMAACALSVPQVTNFQQVTRVFGFAATYTVYLISAANPGWRQQMMRPLLFLFACELLLFATPAMIQRDQVSLDGTAALGRYDDGSAKAVALVQALEPSGAIFRIEKTYNSVFLDDALVQDYPGIKSYYHNNSSVTRFVDKLAIPRPVQHSNWIGAPACCHGVLDLVGVKYELTRQRNLDGRPGMTYVGTAGGVDVYRNESARSFGYFYDRVIAETQVEALAPAQRTDFMLNNITVDDPAAITTWIDSQPPPRADQTRLQPRAELHKLRDDRLEGPVQTPLPHVLLLSMPFDLGWSASLDGSPLKLFRADYGLTAALVPAGMHQLQLQYSPPGRDIGIWLSAASMAFLALVAFSRRVNRPAGTMHNALPRGTFQSTTPT